MFIGLGSNINPEENLKSAAQLLRNHWPDIQCSSVYRTAPRDIEDQPDFLNAVARFETDESPEEISKTLTSIEDQLGKSSPYRFGPRTIDLDLLLYGDEVIETHNLHVPHPRMRGRRFVLEPLCELLTQHHSFEAILGETLEDLLASVQNQRCEKTQLDLNEQRYEPSETA